MGKKYSQTVSDKGLIAQVYKKLNNAMAKTTANNPIKKWTRDLNMCPLETFLQRRYTRKWSTSLVVREKQVKATMRYHVTPGLSSFFKRTFY